jgi:hypothetical protein
MVESPVDMTLQNISPQHYTGLNSPIFNFSQIRCPTSPKKPAKPSVKPTPAAPTTPQVPSVGLTALRKEAANLDGFKSAANNSFPKKTLPSHQSTPKVGSELDLMQQLTQRVIKESGPSAGIVKPRHLDFNNPTAGPSNITAPKRKFHLDTSDEDDDLEILDPDKPVNILVYQPEAIKTYTTVSGDFSTTEFAESKAIIPTEIECGDNSFVG